MQIRCLWLKIRKRKTLFFAQNRCLYFIEKWKYNFKCMNFIWSSIDWLQWMNDWNYLHLLFFILSTSSFSLPFDWTNSFHSTFHTGNPLFAFMFKITHLWKTIKNSRTLKNVWLTYWYRIFGWGGRQTTRLRHWVYPRVTRIPITFF